MDKMWFQNGTTSKGENNKNRNEKYLPYAFTEQGIAMLSGVLKNDIAIEVSINIMRAFIEMRKFINTNKEMYHLGASIKDLGKKCFGINKIEDMEVIEKIVTSQHKSGII